MPNKHRIIRVAAYQAPLLPGGSMAAIGLVAQQVRACEFAGVELLCCPEGVLGGLADYSARPLEIAIGARNGQLQNLLDPIASDTVTAVLGFTEMGEDGRLFNSAAVVHKGDIVGLCRKIHPAINRSVYEPGHDSPVFQAGNLTFGVLICRDSTYPELARILVERGASVLLVPTNNGLPASKGGADIVEHARRTDVSLARDNGVMVVRADVAGRADDLISHGSSAIVDQTGKVLSASTPFEAGLIVAEMVATPETSFQRQESV
jgi:predicted amidohydrolase